MVQETRLFFFLFLFVGWCLLILKYFVQLMAVREKKILARATVALLFLSTQLMTGSDALGQANNNKLGVITRFSEIVKLQSGKKRHYCYVF